MFSSFAKVMLAVALAGYGATAQAAECGPKLICAERPQSIVDGLNQNGLQAELGENDSAGNPKIYSVGTGLIFDVVFQGCKEGQGCSSLRFIVEFGSDPSFSQKLIDKWNRTDRFGRMAIAEDGGLILVHDMTTTGGLNKGKFRNAINRWKVTLDDASKFLAQA